MTATRTAPPTAAADRPRSIGYLPGLDGLRGVALIGVLLFHAGHLGGGFLSVDLFFVLSGFLITSLLIVEWRAGGTIDLVRFWSRRARRLLPGAVVAVAGITVFAALHLEDGALARFRGDALATLANLANWRAISAGSDYWAAFEEPSPLRHMWSLAIEEQLYLLWPIVLLVALRAGRSRGRSHDTAVLVAAGLYVASVAAMVLTSGRATTIRAYYGTDTRASAVLLGAILALVLQRWQRRNGADRVPELVRVAAAPAAVLLAIGWVVADGESRWVYLWGFPVFAAAAAVLVAWSATVRSGPVLDVLTSWPLRTLGVMSYGIYLVHWPVFVALDEDLGWSRWALTAVRFAVSVGLAAGLLRFVEQPVRSGRVGTQQWRVLALGGIALVAAGVFTVTQGAHGQGNETGDLERSATGPASAPLAVLIGDSQATALSEGAEQGIEDELRLASSTAVGCGIGPGVPVTEDVVIDHDFDGRSCLDAVDRMVAAVEGERPDLVLVHAGAWEIFDRRIDGEVVHFGTPEWDEVTRGSLTTVLGRLTAASARVVVLAAPCFPQGAESGADIFGDIARAEGAVRIQADRVHHWNDLLRDVAVPAGVEVLPYDELFCGDDEAGPFERDDGVHLTEEGAAESWQWILPRLGLLAGT